MTHLGYTTAMKHIASILVSFQKAQLHMCIFVHVQLTKTAIFRAIKLLLATNYNILQARLVTVLHGI